MTNVSSSFQRHIVAEAIKLSNIPLERLLDLLRDENVTPNWDHMFLPPGKFLDLQSKSPKQGSPDRKY